MKRFFALSLILVMFFVCGCSLSPVQINGVVTFGFDPGDVSISTSVEKCSVVFEEPYSYAFSGLAQNWRDELRVEFTHDGTNHTSTYDITPKEATTIQFTVTTIGDILR